MEPPSIGRMSATTTLSAIDRAVEEKDLIRVQGGLAVHLARNVSLARACR